MYNFNEGLLAYLDECGLLGESHASWQFILTLFSFVIISIAVSYLLGSINSAILISNVIYRDDIRNHGSGNGGMTNMLRTFGMKAAGLTLLGDLLKTALSIFITGILLGFYYNFGISGYLGFCYMSALFAVLGHVFPIYYGFKGGKGVLVTAVSALILSPIPFLVLMLLFVAIVYFSKYVSLGSVSVAVLYPVLLNGYFAIFGANPGGIAQLSVTIIAIFIVWCHRENLKRISDRTERKISFKKKDVEVKSEEQTDGDKK